MNTFYVPVLICLHSNIQNLVNIQNINSLLLILMPHTRYIVFIIITDLQHSNTHTHTQTDRHISAEMK